MLEPTSAPVVVAILAAILLVAGGVKVALNRATRVRGVLMIVAAAVLIMNVMIWTV